MPNLHKFKGGISRRTFFSSLLPVCTFGKQSCESVRVRGRDELVSKEKAVLELNIGLAAGP